MSSAPNSRSIRLIGFIAFLLLCLPKAAHAFDMEGATIKGELLLPNDDGELKRLNPNEEDIKDHFNYANCVCGAPVLFGVRVGLENAPASFADSQGVEILVGTSCDAAPDNIQVRDDNCEDAGTVDDVEDLKSLTDFPISVASLVAANVACDPTETGDRSVYALIDEGSRGIDGEDIATILLDIPFDLEAPPAPTDMSLEGAEGGIRIGWKLPTSRADDIRFFQALCARADGSTSEEDKFSSLTPQYLTSEMACGMDLDETHPSPLPEIANPMPALLHNLDTVTLCGQVAGTSTEMRVEGLENDVDYRVILLAIDDYRNVTALDLGEAKPAPVEDGWEHYKANGGNADGGFCFVATATYGNYDHPFVKILRVFRDDTLTHSAWGRGFIRWYYDNSPALAAFISEHTVARVVSYLLLAPLVSFAAVLEYTGPLGKLGLLLALGLLIHLRRQRRAMPKRPTKTILRARRLVLATASLLLLLGLSATAHAQPYWDEYNEEIEEGDAISKWNFELKVGPYYPSVDDSANGTPFKTMFGDKWKLMTVLGIDRYFAFPSGQLGITATIGFSNRTVSAFALDEDGKTFLNSKGDLTRSGGDSTGFRLMPTSLGVVYRFTRLDDDYGIPIVPYGKLSLAYYLWSFTAPNGDTSTSYDGDKGRGGSLGYQGTLGIAIRAERIDPGAELSLRTEMGIEHAGFFAEVQLAEVDGFGAKDKLSVGDTTWFGGINFEF